MYDPLSQLGDQMHRHLLFTALLVAACGLKDDSATCDTGFEMNDGACYPVDSPAVTDGDGDVDFDGDMDGGPPDNAGDGDADGGTPPDNDGDGDADGGTPPDSDGDGDADGGPPPDDGGDVDADGSPPPDDGGDTDTDGGPPPDDGGDTDEGPPPDDGGDIPEDSDSDGGTTPDGTCETDEDCPLEACPDESTGCACLEIISSCVPTCSSAADCPPNPEDGTEMSCLDGFCEP